MTRVIALNLLLIFLPFLLYAAYVMIEKKPEDKEQFWGYIPLKPLFIIGFFLMAVFYISQINKVPETKDGIYHPATVKDGKVIPGYVEPFDKNKNDKNMNEKDAKQKPDEKK